MKKENYAFLMVFSISYFNVKRNRAIVFRKIDGHVKLDNLTKDNESKTNSVKTYSPHNLSHKFVNGKWKLKMIRNIFC